MPDPTLADLAARVARIEATLGLTSNPAPATPPPPDPAVGAPAPPTGLACTIGPDMRPALTWDPAADVTSWDVLDVLDAVTPVKDTVTAPRSVRSPLQPGAHRRYAVRARNTAGAGPLSAAIDVPASSPTPSAPSSSAPGALLDLSRWHLTLPIPDPHGSDQNAPWNVHQPALATFVHPQFFRTGADAHGRYVEYVAPTKGVTTSDASGSTRDELRQDQDWAFGDDKSHTLTVTFTCDGTSIVGRQEVIVGQIHGPGGTPPLILCMNHTRGALEVFRQGPRQGDLLTGLTPGELLTYRIDASGNRLRVWAARGDVAQLPAEPGFDWPASVLTEQAGLYLKAGAYNKQPIATAAAGAAIVRHYKLDMV